MIYVWEISMVSPFPSTFYETKERALAAFRDAIIEVWWNPESYPDSTVTMYKVGLAPLPKKALLCACLSHGNFAASKEEFKKWTRSDGCPNIDGQSLLDEYLGGEKLEVLVAKYGIARSTIYDRMMKARSARK